MKDWNTPRAELICGKIDEAERISAKAELVEIMPILQYIRHDAERMEQGLIRRKDEVTTVSAELRRLRISQLRRMADACALLFSRAVETAERAPEFPPAERIIAINARIRRFRAACLAEIESLRGEG